MLYRFILVFFCCGKKICKHNKNVQLNSNTTTEMIKIFCTLQMNCIYLCVQCSLEVCNSKYQRFAHLLLKPFPIEYLFVFSSCLFFYRVFLVVLISYFITIKYIHLTFITILCGHCRFFFSNPSKHNVDFSLTYFYLQSHEQK